MKRGWPDPTFHPQTVSSMDNLFWATIGYFVGIASTIAALLLVGAYLEAKARHASHPSHDQVAEEPMND